MQYPISSQKVIVRLLGHHTPPKYQIGFFTMVILQTKKQKQLDKMNNNPHKSINLKKVDPNKKQLPTDSINFQLLWIFFFVPKKRYCSVRQKRPTSGHGSPGRPPVGGLGVLRRRGQFELANLFSQQTTTTTTTTTRGLRFQPTTTNQTVGGF